MTRLPASLADQPLRRIQGPACLARGARALAQAEPRLLPALALDLPLRLAPPGFAALVHAIAGQQISTAAAAAIVARLVAAGLDQPGVIRAEGAGALVAAGLSRPKAGHVLALALADPDLGALADLPDDQALARLVALPGIGRWTAEIYLALHLGRADIFPAGDLALQKAAQSLFSLPARPSEAGLRALAAGWSPWRAVAARALWAYYRHAVMARPAGAKIGPRTQRKPQGKEDL